MNMDAIGGYFELENTGTGRDFPHNDGIFLNTGRNALEYILLSITHISKIYVPYYTCEVILEPLHKLNIQYAFYHINQNLEIAEDIILNDGEYIIVTNYFGIKDNYILYLANKYGERLIVDNAQALYAKHLDEIKTIYSPRKFVGIADGGIAFTDNGPDISNFDIDDSSKHNSHLLIRKNFGAEKGYAAFRENSKKLANSPIKRMSTETTLLLNKIDFEKIKEIRIGNFSYLHNILKDFNILKIPEISTFECPMVYPLYTNSPNLRKNLIDNKIFVAQYWPNVPKWTNGIESDMTKSIIPLPIDQRYGINSMEKILNILLA